MILEELFGSFVALVSSVIIQAPPMSRESSQRQYTLIFEENPEQDEVCDGLIHREYEQEAQRELPYYEEDISVLGQADEQPRRNFCESFVRSFKANIGLVTAAVFILGLLTIGLVYVDLNTRNACIAWMHNNFTVPSDVQTVRIVGDCVVCLPVFALFPGCVVMLWGFKTFKKNYLLGLSICQVVTLAISYVYRIILYDQIVAGNIIYRLLGNVVFFLYVVCCAYLVAHVYKQVNPAASYSVFRIFSILSFAFLGSCLFSYMYFYIVIKYFPKTEEGIKKAIIAALTPGMVIPITAIAKYIVLRKSSEIISPDRAFVMCYFLRGGAIVLYRTMQADFQNIWLFIGLSLLHGVSNVLSKASLNFRIKVWKRFVKCYNRICCGPRLEVQPLNSPRIRRLNADLEIQNILFEYATIILSQTYFACYLVMSFDVPPWQIIKGSLIRIAISLAIDFVFNIISVFIQIRFYDIPMRKVWLKYWRRHVAANAFMIVILLANFSTSLVSVFVGRNNMLTEYKLRNCTSIF